MSTEERLIETLTECVDAMRYAEEVRCVKYLDYTDDGGEFWYTAIENAQQLLREIKCQTKQSD